MKIENERGVMLALSWWLDMFDIDVWWNHENEYFPVFHSKGSGQSDIIIKHKNTHYLIECKHAVLNKNVYDAFFQIIDYSISDTKYFIDGIETKIDSFLIATENSMKGHLFKVECEVLMNQNDFTEGRNVAIKNGEIPHSEYSMTELMCRLLWRGIPRYNITKPIGVLLADNLNNDSSIFPLVLLKDGKTQYMKVLR